MKKLFISLAIVLSTLTANAQFYVAGTANIILNSIKNTNDDNIISTKFSLAPEFGGYLNDNIALGLGIGGSYEKTTEMDPTEEFFLNPYVRLVSNKNKRLQFFGELSYLFATTRQPDDRGVTYSKIGLRYGIALAFTKNIKGILRAETLSYTINNRPINGVKNNFNFTWNPNFSWGLEYTF